MFRRNKTIVSVSYAKKRRRKYVWLSVFAAVLLAIVVGTLIYIAWRPFWLVTTVVVEGTTYTDPDAVKRTVEASLAGKYGYMLPRRNALLLPRGEIISALLEQEKAIKEIDIDLAGFTGLTVQVKEHVPFTRWCRTMTINDQSLQSGECFVMSPEGYIFAFDTRADEAVAFPVRWYGLIEEDNPRGTSFVIDPSLERWREFAVMLDRMHLKADTITAKGNGEYEVTLYSGQKLFLNNKQSLERSLSSLRTVLTERGGGMFATTTPFEYVDLRFGSKVYVK